MSVKTPVNNHFLTRDLSWLEFNARVLDEAADAAMPLLDRLKFIAIFSNNLDEFFMVRVAGLRRQVEAKAELNDPAGLTAKEQLRRIRQLVTVLQHKQHRLMREEIMPGLESQGIGIKLVSDLQPAERERLSTFFQREVLPVLTPVAVDPSHPFPILASGVLEIAVQLKATATGGKKGQGRAGEKARIAFVEVPKLLPRFVRLPSRRVPDKGCRFVLLEDLILTNLDLLFPGTEIMRAFPFRITRDMDFSLDEESAADLLKVLADELRHRKRREALRIELPSGVAGGALLTRLLGKLELESDDLYEQDGPLRLADFMSFVDSVKRPDLQEPEWPPLSSPLLRANEPVVQAIRRHGTIPLFHPYELFQPVIRFLEEAADDPKVLAIKQTLYRVSGDSPIIRALQRAAENGKQVTVIVEVRARFDEERNIQWVRSLEQSGVHVIYGVVGLKIHCKALLVVRREEGRVRRYVHLGTGNYNDRTARVYTDIGIFMDDPEICQDVAALFNVITGLSLPPAWNKIAAAPFNLRQTFLELIDREARLSTPARPGRITVKINSLVDPEIIDHLVTSARAGVQIDLIVRGICCLRPGIDDGGNIRVVSVVDRFLEHSRIYRFENGGTPDYFLSSADWMPRNLDRRVELLFPVESPVVRSLLDEMLALPLADGCKNRDLRPDGSYSTPGVKLLETRSQWRTYELLRQRLATAQQPPPANRELQPIRRPPAL